MDRDGKQFAAPVRTDIESLNSSSALKRVLPCLTAQNRKGRYYVTRYVRTTACQTKEADDRQSMITFKGKCCTLYSGLVRNFALLYCPLIFSWVGRYAHLAIIIPGKPLTWSSHCIMWRCHAIWHATLNSRWLTNKPFGVIDYFCRIFLCSGIIIMLSKTMVQWRDKNCSACNTSTNAMGSKVSNLIRSKIWLQWKIDRSSIKMRQNLTFMQVSIHIPHAMVINRAKDLYHTSHSCSSTTSIAHTIKSSSHIISPHQPHENSSRSLSRQS